MSSVNRNSVELGADRVIKRFRSWDRGEHLAEWHALTLLAEYAPGLAPEPLSADLAGEPPTVVMSLLAGTPLRGGHVDTARIEALAAAVDTLHTAVPPDRLAALPRRRWHEAEIVAQLRAWRAEPLAPDTPRSVIRAWEAGFRRLEAATPSPDETPAVFGPGDGNLANYLWDGMRVRVVDFEDSGRSDRGFELAEITEHVSSWVDTEFDAARFLDCFDLTRAERARLRHCRTLIALVWLVLLSWDAARRPAERRNPPGTAERQAERLLALL